MRTVADEDDDEEDEHSNGFTQRNTETNASDIQQDYDDDQGIHAVKPVVGPDELLPGDQEQLPKNGEKMVGFTQALMWLPAIFDVSAVSFG